MSVVLGAALLALASCDWLFQPEYRSVVSSVDSVSVPQAVRASETFAVTIHTSVPNSCWRKGHDIVRRTRASAAVVPHERIHTGIGACLTVVGHHRHVIPLRFDDRGSAFVLVRDRLYDGSLGTIVREIVVS